MTRCLRPVLLAVSLAFFFASHSLNAQPGPSGAVKDNSSTPIYPPSTSPSGTAPQTGAPGPATVPATTAPSTSSAQTKTPSGTRVIKANTSKGTIEVKVGPANGLFSSPLLQGTLDYTVYVTPPQGDATIVEIGGIFPPMDQSKWDNGQSKIDSIIDHWTNAPWPSTQTKAAAAVGTNPAEGEPAQPGQGAPGPTGSPTTSPAASSSDLKLTQTTNGNVTTSTWTAPDGTVVWENTLTVNADKTTTWVANYYENGKVVRTETLTTAKDGTTNAAVSSPGRPTVTIDGGEDGEITSIDELNPPAPAASALARLLPWPIQTFILRVTRNAVLSFTAKPQPADSQQGGQSGAAPGSLTTVSQYVNLFLTWSQPQENADDLAVIIGPGELANSATEPGEPTFLEPSGSSGCITLTDSEVECGVTFTLPPSQAPAASQSQATTEEAEILFPEGALKNGASINVSGDTVYVSPDGSVIGSAPLNFEIPGGSTPSVSANVVPNGPQISLTPSTSSEPGTLTSELDLTFGDLFHSYSFLPYLESMSAASASGSSPAPPNPSAPANPPTATVPSTTPTTSGTPTAPAIKITVPATGPYFNQTTGEMGIFTPGENLLGNWKAMPPVPAPPTLTSGTSTSFLPVQGPALYVNKTNDNWLWGSWPSTAADTSAQALVRTLSSYGRSTSESASPTPPGTQTPAVRSSLTDFGSGSYVMQQNGPSGDPIERDIYDPTNALRQQITNSYTTFNNKQYLSQTNEFGYNPKGGLEFSSTMRYDLDGSPTFSDYTGFGSHRQRTYEQITNYYKWGFVTIDWSPASKDWSRTFTTYKFAATTGSTTPTPAPYMPIVTSAALICPRNSYAGSTLDCLLSTSAYADNFNKAVPGLDVSYFSIVMPHLPDGTPSWSSLKIGGLGEGYVRARSDGHCSFHLPLNWEPPLSLQVQLVDTYPGASPTTAQVGFSSPVAAPTLPAGAFSSQTATNLKHSTEVRLVHLWNEADDLEEELEAAHAAQKPVPLYIAWLEDELSSVYNEIDDIESILPSNEIVSIADGMSIDANGFDVMIGNETNPTDDEKAEQKSSIHWENYLKSEIDYTKFRSNYLPSNPYLGAYWTNPIVNESKLNVFHGPFGFDPRCARIRIDNYLITPFVSTSTDIYYLSPTGLTADQHQVFIDSPAFPETIFSVFGMGLTMGAGQLSLHKDMTTTYFARLNVFNGSSPQFPSIFNGQPFYETDIIDPSELSAIQRAEPNARTGFISFTVTNESTNITMKNEARDLNASDFVPSGSYEIDGDITAIKDGNFVILGVARANLAPIGGIGPLPGTTPSTEEASSSSWLPSFSLGSNPTLANSATNATTNCSAPATTTLAAGPTAVPGQTTPTTTNATSSTTLPGQTTPVTSMPTTTTTTIASTSPTTPTTTTTPTTPTTSTTPPGCTGDPDEELLDQAMQVSPSVTVGDNPTTIDEAKEKVSDAQKKVDQAQSNLYDAQDDEEDAFDDGFDNAPQGARDVWNQFNNRYEWSANQLEEMKKRYKQNRSDDNLRNLEMARRMADSDEAELHQIERNIVEQFLPEDRKDWQTAHDAVGKALDDLNAARAEQRAAERALEEAQRGAAK